MVFHVVVGRDHKSGYRQRKQQYNVDLFSMELCKILILINVLVLINKKKDTRLFYNIQGIQGKKN